MNWILPLPPVEDLSGLGPYETMRFRHSVWPSVAHHGSAGQLIISLHFLDGKDHCLS